jgi:tight adherence protein B
MSLMFFLLTLGTTLLTYTLAASRMDRRRAELAVRRVGAPAKEMAVRGRGRPRLIEAATQVRGRLTAELLDRLRVKQSAVRLLETAAIKWGPAGLLHRSLALFVGTFAIVTLATGNAMVPAALAAGAVASSIPLLYVRRAARKRVMAFEEQFPDCLEFLSRSMRAGHAFSVAIEMVHREYSDPLSVEFRRVFEEQNLGQPLDIVLMKLSQRIPSMDVQFFVSAVLLQKRTGGNLAELLDKLAQLIRERFKLRARIRTVSAQGLMSGRILAAIPAAVGILMFVVNPQYARFFVDDPMGHQLLAASIGLQFVGYLIIKKIVTIEV